MRTLHDEWKIIDKCGEWSAHYLRAWKMADLQLLPRLAHLTSIQHVMIHMSDVATSELHFAFPPHLTCVDLHLAGDGDGDSQLAASRRVLEALAPCASLTAVKLGAWRCRWDLSPLLQMRQMRRLALMGSYTLHFGDQEMPAIKQLDSLHHLVLTPAEDWVGARDWLFRLCRPPHRLQQLQSVDLSELRAAAEDLEAMQTLPGLTELHPASIDADAVPSLAHFSHLADLGLSFIPGFAAAEDQGHRLVQRDFPPRATLLLGHLVCGASLLTLGIDQCVFSEEEAETLCELIMLPHLRNLTMSNIVWPSLHPLRQLTQLTALDFRLAAHTTLDFSIEHLQPLQSLRSLLRMLSPPLHEATVAALHPPSALLPKLERFQSLAGSNLWSL